MFAAVETDTGTWIAAGIGALGLVATVAIYVFTRGRMRLEYVVLTKASLLPGPVATELEVSRDGTVVPAPALTITRLVNVGNRPIRAGDFESDLTVTFEGAEEVESAVWSASRPSDLRPSITVNGHRVNVAPALLNAGDMLELQMLSSGKPEQVTITGRVAGLTLAQRAALPYNPGMGAEGELEGRIDHFMWFVGTPGLIVGAAIAFAVQDSMTTLGRWLTAVAAIILVCGDLLLTRYLVRRRRRWRPY